MPDDSTQFDTPAQKPRKFSWPVWIAIFGGIALLFLIRESIDTRRESVGQLRFEQLVDGGYLVKAAVMYEPRKVLTEIVGTYYQIRNGARIEIPFRAEVRLTDSLEDRLYRLPNIQARQRSTLLFELFWNLFPLLAVAGVLWFGFIRHIKRISGERPPGASPTPEQWDRLQKLADKWEEQTKRMDDLLEKLERK